MIRSMIWCTICEDLHRLRFRVYAVGTLLLFVVGTFVFLTSWPGINRGYASRDTRLRNRTTLESTVAILPGNELGFVVRDDNGGLPAELRVLPYEVDDFANSRSPLPVDVSTNHIDWLFLVGIWCSLAALALSFDAVAGAREDGVLGMLLAYPASRAEWLLGRSVGKFALCYAPVAASIVLSAAIVLIVSPLNNLRVDMAEVVFATAMSAMAAAAYLCFFVMLGVLLSVVCTTSTQALLRALFIWIVLVWAWPALSVLQADLIRPIPSYREAQQKWTDASGSGFTGLSSSVLAPVVASSMPEAQKRDAIAALAIQEERRIALAEARILESRRALRQEYRALRQAQTEVGMTLLRISPYGQLKSLLSILAVSDEYRYRTYLSSTARYADYFGQRTDELKARYDSLATYRSRASVALGDYSMTVRFGKTYRNVDPTVMNVDPFVLHKPPLRERLLAIAPILALLLVEVCLIFLVTTIMIGRCDVA